MTYNKEDHLKNKNFSSFKMKCFLRNNFPGKNERFEKLSHIQTRLLVFGNYGVLYLLLNFDFKSDLLPLDFSREILNLKCVVYKK